jgi:hypothetical protein
MNTLTVKESLPQAPAETAIVKSEPFEIITTEPTVSEPSSQTVGEIELTDPTVQTVHELAPIVIQAFGKIRPAIPHILTFFRKCKELERDENNRWLEPVEGCYSVKEFCEKKLFRSPSAIYKAVREAQPKLTDGTPKPKPKPTAPAVKIVLQKATAEEVAAEVEHVKDEIFENGRLAEKMSQGIAAAKVTDTQALALLEAQDVILIMTRLAKESAVRKIGVKYCKSHNIDLTCPPPEVKPSKSKRKTAAEITEEADARLKGEPTQAKPTQVLAFVADGSMTIGHMYSENSKGTAPEIEFVTAEQHEELTRGTCVV